MGLGLIEDVGSGWAWQHRTLHTTRDFDQGLIVGRFCQITDATLKNITKPLATGSYVKGVVVRGCCNNGATLENHGVASVVVHGGCTVQVKQGVNLKRGEPLFIVATAGAEAGKVTNQQGTAGTDTVATPMVITASQPVGEGAWLIHIV